MYREERRSTHSLLYFYERINSLKVKGYQTRTYVSGYCNSKEHYGLASFGATTWPKKWPLMAFPDIIIYCFKNVNFWQAKEEIALTQLFGCWAIQQTLFVKDKSVLQEHKYLVYLRVVEKKTTWSSQLLSLKQI